MKKIKVAIIGAGNISNTRHIPALKKLRNVEIIGVVGVKKNNIDRTLKRYNIKNSLLLKDELFFDGMKSCEWFNDVDAVIIGVPPKGHYALVEAALKNKKHVLVEKPMTMNVNEADVLINLSKKMNKIFCVMHNFQYTSGMQKLDGIINKGGLGKIISFWETQLTNENRRLPEWYNDLPLGLFYDEAPHFIYLLEKYGGKISVENAYAQFDKDVTKKTPVLMSVMMRAGEYPVNLFLNFKSPICEWYFVVCGEKKVAFYDLFKDILVVLPSDNEHYAMDVLKNSWRMTIQYWWGFLKNGLKMINGNLLYGHDVVISKFIHSIIDGQNAIPEISCKKGRETVGYMNDIINEIDLKRNRNKNE